MLGGAEQKSHAQKITEARPPQAAELTVLKLGSNFFVNLDQSRHFKFSGERACSLAPPSAGLASQKALYFGIKS